MSQTFIVLDVRGYAGQLVHFSEEFCAVMNPRLDGMINPRAQRYRSLLRYTPLTPFTIRRAYGFMAVQVRELIEAWVTYTQPTDNYQEFGRLLFSNDALLITPAHQQLIDYFNKTPAVSKVLSDLNRQLMPHFGDNRWQEWSVYQHGEFLAIAGGRDYRVVEWERLTGYNQGSQCEISLCNMVVYIQTQLTERFGDAVRFLDLCPIIMDAIRRRFPRISFEKFQIADREINYVFEQNPSINYDTLFRLGIHSYEQFYEQFIGPVFDAFAALNLVARLDSTVHYEGSLDGYYNLTLTPLHTASVTPTQLEIAELAESLMRGDWLPPKDRKLAEDYLLSIHNL